MKGIEQVLTGVAGMGGVREEPTIRLVSNPAQREVTLQTVCPPSPPLCPPNNYPQCPPR